jgi:uncharacterized protein (DUF2126 family)
LGPQVIRLRPAPHTRTRILSYSLNVKPADFFINWQQDPHGNYQARYVFHKTTHEFIVEVDLIAELTASNPFDFFLEKNHEQFPFVYEPALKKELAPYLVKAKRSAIFQSFAQEIRLKKQDTMPFLVDVNRWVKSQIQYVIRMEPGVQSPGLTIKRKKGSCRDSAWLLVNLLRHLGLAARFVSGYIIQLKADVASLDGSSGPPADFSDLHAWTEVYLPGAGWVGLDPTSGLLAGEGHIPLACTPEPTSAAPVSGALDDCAVDFSHAIAVTRIAETPRVTKPYTDKQLSQIAAVGAAVDQRLKSGDVRLTSGGEPTFVSVDDQHSPEWNTEALGASKFKLASDLLGRLKEAWGRGALLHFGQGKWYPGEVLPRWALACYWRSDGVPIWKDACFLAGMAGAGGCALPQARMFITTLAERLGIDEAKIMPAFEDPWFYFHKEQSLPVNVDSKNARLIDPLDGERVARLLQGKLKDAAGFVLPLAALRQNNQTNWISQSWRFRCGTLCLIPGDSPLGLRLPLSSLYWEPTEMRFAQWERDPMDSAFKESLPQMALDGGRGAYSASRQRIAKPHNLVTKKIVSADPAPFVRTALCVEPRDGRLYIFMPPLGLAEDYLQLIAAIEDVASYLKIPVVIEGEAPPQDPRIKVLKITPDPGVIEVNLPPTDTWDELVSQTQSLYQQARHSRLSAEKFMLDGKHCGSGGGNHIVLGGATPADSPFLRRPELLASLLAYWNNHPSLSYLFSGLFIGPTSQAPRVDEGRRDSVYELEIALAQTRNLKNPLPWMSDRIFRHLLVDLTGNTHRSEFCIDKLYSPDSKSGRLGVVEFRGFEMPAHAEMSMVQQLLLRALLVSFWERPYQEKLVRWGTALHDRFMLPYFVRLDFEDVLSDLQKSGFALFFEHVAPHFEFRFPAYGSVAYHGIQLELRQAIEPWFVLGEEPAGGSTARYVDSSVERLQVKVAGLSDPRFIITCNGRRLPLHPTGVPGEWVAGLRYRAWQPPSCLHPTIAVHAPLVFNILDTWNMQSLGGCSYHVAHPGGRHYERYPVNALEAEGRRINRFMAMGHTPGPIESLPPEEQKSDFPFTLDLRKN